MAEQMRLLYVGSIKPENAAKLLGLADVDRCPGQRREPGRSEFSGDCQGRLRHLGLKILRCPLRATVVKLPPSYR